MGRLEIQVRHGGGGSGQSGAVIALIVFIVVAIAGGAAHKALTGAAHAIGTAVEVVMWTLTGVAGLAATAGIIYAALRVRGAVRAARARRQVPPPVITITAQPPGPRYLPPDGRPAIGAARAARSWPLPGWWEEIRPQIGGDSDEHRPR